MVVARHELLLLEIPEREIEVLPRPADQSFELVPKNSRVVRLQASLGVESLKHGEPDDLLHLEVVLDLRAGGHESPSVLPPLLVQQVIACALFRISQDGVGLEECPESALVAGLLIVGMEALRQQPVDPVDCLWVGARVDLQHFVIIDWLLYWHTS